MRFRIRKRWRLRRGEPLNQHVIDGAADQTHLTFEPHYDTDHVVAKLIVGIHPRARAAGSGLAAAAVITARQRAARSA